MGLSGGSARASLKMAVTRRTDSKVDHAVGSNSISAYANLLEYERIVESSRRGGFGLNLHIQPFYPLRSLVRKLVENSADFADSIDFSCL